MEEKSEQSEKKNLSVTCGDWPPELFDEWSSDCKKNFNDIRWVKMWYDHNKSKEHDTLLILIGKQAELEQRLDSLAELLKDSLNNNEKSKLVEKEKTITFGGQTE